MINNARTVKAKATGQEAAGHPPFFLLFPCPKDIVLKVRLTVP